MSQLVDTGNGVAEFPDGMSQDEIAGVIKKQFYSPENPLPAEIKSTSSAKAENVIAGMDQAPTYPSKANADPLTVKIAGQDNEPFVSPQIATAAGRGSVAALSGGLSELLLNAFPESTSAKIAKGGLEAYGDILSGFTTPSNLGLFAVGGPLAKLGKAGTVLLSSAFEAQALKQAPEQWKQFKEAYDAGDYQTATRVGADLLGGVTLPAAAVGVHAFAPKTLTEKLAPISGEAPPVQEVSPAEAIKPEEVTAKPETPTPQGQPSQETGQPLNVVAYHGSRGTSGELDATFRGLGTESKSAKDAFFFTSDKRLAQDYADMALPKDILETRKQINLLEDEKQKLKEQFSIDLPARQQDVMHQRYAEIESSLPALRTKVGEYLLERGRREELGGLTGDKGANVFPKQLTFRNPLVVDFNGKPFREQTYASFIERAKNEGRDGVVFKNTFDPASGYREQRPTTIYAAIHPEAISNYKALSAATSRTQIPSESQPNLTLVPEASQAPVESGLQAKPELPENVEVTIKASTSKGEELEVKMDAREAEKVLNERKTALENLIDCLGA